LFGGDGDIAKERLRNCDFFDSHTNGSPNSAKRKAFIRRMLLDMVMNEPPA
jgi:hypothetical protein